MKSLIVTALFMVLVVTSNASDDAIYMSIQFHEGGESLMGGSASGGCTVAPGEACNGLFYRNEDGSGIVMGPAMNSVQGADFELLFSYQVEPTDRGLDLVVSTHMMTLDNDGAILQGRKTAYREPVRFGDQVEIPVGSIFGGDPVTLSIKVGTRSDPPWGHNGNNAYQVQLISTNIGPAETMSRQTSHRRQLSPRLKFSSDFRDVAGDQANHKSLRYHVQVYLDGWQEGAPSNDCVLRYKRQYLVDSSHSEGNQNYAINAKFQSEYERAVQLSPDKVIKLVFPPDQPSVHGFDIEDTLVISIDHSASE